MSSEEPKSGLLSRLARFVRHPTVEWSELDASGSSKAGAAPQGREAVKAVLESRSRNDQLRQREFDKLRELMRQRRAEQAHAAAQGVDSGPGSAAGSDEGSGSVDATIEKIARIEAQMSRHWFPAHAGEAGEGSPQLRISAAELPSRHDGGVTVPAHLQATQPVGLPGRDLSLATTLPLGMLESDFAALHLAAPVPESEPSSALATTAELEEAAVRFANGDEAAAERSLREAIAHESGGATLRLAWESLLDFYVATGRPAAFEQAALEFSALHRVQLPEWPAMPTATEAVVVWRCPPVLDLDAVGALAAALEPGCELKTLDWSALVSADLAAARALLALAERWTEGDVEFQFAGADVLRRRLKASTPSGRRENDALWWRLRLALLRLMHRVDEFDLAALDFCVTYGELPPDWVEPRSRYRAADELAESPEPSGLMAIEPEAPVVVEPIRPLATQLVGLDVLEWPALAQGGTTAPSRTSAVPEPANAAPQLRRELRGDIAPALARLQAALDRHPRGEPFAIDCRALGRVDFAAAGSLLQWLLGASAQGVQPELHGVNRLTAIFFHVVGLDETALVRLREY